MGSVIVVIVVAGQRISFAFSKWPTDMNSPKFHFSQRNSLGHRPLKTQVAGLYHLGILISSGSGMESKNLLFK